MSLWVDASGQLVRGTEVVGARDFWRRDRNTCPFCGTKWGGSNVLIGEETFCGVAFATKTCLSCKRMVSAEKKFQPGARAPRQWTW